VRGSWVKVKGSAALRARKIEIRRTGDTPTAAAQTVNHFKIRLFYITQKEYFNNEDDITLKRELPDEK
jgi:type IV secretory pathway VirD2 relaxase